MPRHQLEGPLWVAPQIEPGDLNELAAAGFRTVTCNRPDGESADQPSSQIIAAAAQTCGMAFVAIPVLGNAIGDADIDAFATMLAEHPGPMLAYCRTGTRAAMLWALARSRTHPADDLIATAARAGYDLTALRPRLLARARASCP